MKWKWFLMETFWVSSFFPHLPLYLEFVVLCMWERWKQLLFVINGWCMCVEQSNFSLCNCVTNALKQKFRAPGKNECSRWRAPLQSQLCLKHHQHCHYYWQDCVRWAQASVLNSTSSSAHQSRLKSCMCIGKVHNGTPCYTDNRMVL